MWIGIFILCVQMIYSSQDQTLFNSASALYQKEEYQQALQALQQIEHKDAAAWFNMGTIAYALNDHLHAYLYWLRAQKYGNNRIFSDATRAIERLEDQFVQPSNTLYNWLWFLSKYSLLWQSIWLVLWYILLYLLYNRRYSSKLYGVIIMLLLALSMPIVVGYHAQKKRCMIMQDTIIYNGPNESFYHIGQLSSGSVVTIKDCMHEWCKISSGVHTGWIERQYVELI